jgi:hypothetical protein
LRRVDAREVVFTGDEAERLLVSTLAHQNKYEGTAKQIKEALQLVEARADLNALIIGGGMPTREGSGTRKLLNLPGRWRLAVEMALHEEREREALAGELKLLEWEWREAERLAKISDALALPPDIDDDLDRRKADT